MLRKLALLSLVLTACQTTTDDGAGTEPHPLGAKIPEIWREKLPEGGYFEGCRLDTLTAYRPLRDTAGEGGFSLVQGCWTDVIICTPVDGNQVCTPGGWSRRYRGTFRREDSSLTFSWRFQSSTPENAPVRLGGDSGEAVFKLRQIEEDARLVMERADSGAGPWPSALELNRLR